MQLHVNAHLSSEVGCRCGGHHVLAVHVLVRRPHSSGSALHQTGKALGSNHSSAGVSDEELSQIVRSRIRTMS